MSKKEQYFWNKKGETFAGCKFGEDVTKYLEGQTERIEEYLKLGKIVTSEPLDFDHAQQDELHALRKEVEKLQLRNKELEATVKKKGSGPAKLKEANEEIEVLKKQIADNGAEKIALEKSLSESVAKVVDLEKQIETLTKPEGK